MNQFRALLVLAFLVPGLSPLAAADEKTPPAKNQAFDQVESKWKAVLAEMAEAQSKIAATSPNGRMAVKAEVEKLFKQADALSPQLQAEAEKAYLADDQNGGFADLLLYMALAHLRSDNYEEALRLSQLLIDHKFPELLLKHNAPDVYASVAYRVAASAAFATMQLDEAKKYIELASGGKEIKDPALGQLLAEIEHYQPMWNREQKLRAAEKQADDLPRVKLHTSEGDIVVELFENEAPNTVANFISLVESGLYNGTQFHRVLPGFMAQGGDPFSKDRDANAGKIGTGGTDYTIACECVLPEHRDHFRGTLSMAHSGPNTGSSQFFLTFVPTGSLDGRHTVFGRIIEGFDVLAKIQRVNPEKPNGEVPDTIIKAEVLRKRPHDYIPKRNGEPEKN